jgi:uncharacterized protein YbaP (TraB family)
MNKRFVRFTMAVAFLVIAVGGGRAAESAATGKRLFLWRIKSAKSTAYVLGSIHVAKPQMYPLDPRIEKAFQNADVLVVEANASPEKMGGMALQLMMRASYPPEDSLEKHISKDVCDATIARVAKFGLPAAQARQMKPWILGMTITLAELQRLGIDPMYGLDMHFLQTAKDKPITELEGAEEQINLLDGLSDKQQEDFLKYTLKDVDNIARNVDELITSWATGDAKKLEEFVLQAVKESPDLQPLFVKLFDERNKQMAAKIETLLQTGKTYFIVVGAGHLVGKTGLLELLGKNHIVEQM